METTKTAEAAEGATETEIDAKAAEVETDKNLIVEDETKKGNENEHEVTADVVENGYEDAEDAEDAEDEAGYELEPVASSGVLAGAAAVIAAGLGLSSLTGTWIGTLMSDRQQLIGQINSSSATTAQQIAQIYGTPWHTVALFNGFFAVAAILVAGTVLLAAKSSAPWTRALAWGGLALGVLGLFIAGVMWFDVFADLPQVAATTASTTG